MIRRQKRAFVSLLAAALVLTMVPPLAFAGGEPEGAAPAESEAAQAEFSPEQSDESEGLLGADEALQGETATIQEELTSSTISIADVPESSDEEENNSLSTFAAGDIPIDAAHFPDDNFRAWLLDGININGVGSDALLEPSEIAGITSIAIWAKGVVSLSGIEYFTALQSLECQYNQLPSLDVSALSSLTSLDCVGNQLTSLNVSGLTYLESLHCPNNQLTSLSLSGLTSLKYLGCSDNRITSLDVSSLTSLEQLYCAANQLASLDVSGLSALIELDCGANQLASLDVLGLTDLSLLGCDNNQLTSLDLTGLSSLDEFRGDGQAVFLTLAKSGNTYVKNIAMNPNTYFGNSALSYANGTLTSTGTTAASVDFGAPTGLVGKTLAGTLTLNYEEQSSTENIPIDAAHFPDDNFRAWLLDASYVGHPGADAVLTPSEIATITSINVDGEGIAELTGIEYFTSLRDLYCSHNQLTSLDVSALSALTRLSCSSNQLTSLDVLGLASLEYLVCSFNRLISLDVSENTALKWLDCGTNSLTSLNASENTALEWLDCSGNSLASLDVSNNPALEQLVCYDNSLTSLDVSNNSALVYFHCASNSLTSLNVSNNPALYTLYCPNNSLTSLDVSGSPGLRIFGCSVNRLLDVVGLPSGLRLDYAGGEYGSGYAGMSDQAVIIPVSVNPASPGSYVSDAAYPLDSGHSIVLANAEASYSNVTKRFRTTVVNTPIGFTDDDGTGQEITGTITFVATTIPGSKDITSFVLAGVRANITGTSITATVPYGTDITALTPIIAHTGAGISLTGAQDFTLPVTYTVIAEDNSTKDYVVTVAVSRSIPLISAPSTWTGAASVVARIDASLADFIRLTLDGVEVNSSNYTLAEGSTVITFAETYLKTLADGEYIFTAEFRNGTADIPLKVSVHPSSEAGFAEGDSRDTLPATGDEGSFALMIVVGLLLGTGAVLLARRHRLRSFLGDRSML